MNYLILILLLLLPGCLFKKDPKIPQKNIKHMDLEEAKVAADYYKSIRDTELVIKSLERIVALSTDYELTDKALLELADLRLQEGNLEAAQKLYAQYNSLYPSSEQCERAFYNEILAHYRDRTTPDRDQTKTREIIALTKRFLERFEQSSYTPKVHEIELLCYRQLLKHELLNIQFYIHAYGYQNKYPLLDAARRRLVFIAQELLPVLTEVNSSIPLIQEQIIKLYKNYKGKEPEAQELYTNVVFYLHELEPFALAPEAWNWESLVRKPKDRF